MEGKKYEENTQDEKPRREHVDLSFPHMDWPGGGPISHLDEPPSHTDKSFRMDSSTPEAMVNGLKTSVAIEKLVQDLTALRAVLNDSVYKGLREFKK